MPDGPRRRRVPGRWETTAEKEAVFRRELVESGRVIEAIVGDENPALHRRAGEEHLVVRPLGIQVDGPHHVPAQCTQGLHQVVVDAGIGEEWKRPATTVDVGVGVEALRAAAWDVLRGIDAYPEKTATTSFSRARARLERHRHEGDRRGVVP